MKTYLLLIVCIFCIASCKKDSNSNNNNVNTNACKNVSCYHTGICSNGYCFCDAFATGTNCDSLLLQKYYRTYNLSCGTLTIDTPGANQGSDTAICFFSCGGMSASQVTDFYPLTGDSSYEADFHYSTSTGPYTAEVGGRIQIYMSQHKTVITLGYSSNFPPGQNGSCDSTFNF